MALTQDQKELWLSEDFHRIVLLDIESKDETFRFSSDPYSMPLLDIWQGFSDLVYDDIIHKTPIIATKLDSQNTVGSIELINARGEYDHLLSTTSIVGHNLKMYIGDKNWPRDNFILLVDGTVKDISSVSSERILISLRDKKETLNINLQDQLIDTAYWDNLMDRIDTGNFFTGTIPTGVGTSKNYDRSLANLTSGVEDSPVPICVGKCFNIEPVLVDSFNHVYLIHDAGQGIQSIDAVRSNGVLLGPEQYEVNTSIGMLRLLDHTNGTQITCDVTGQNGRVSGAPTGPTIVNNSLAHIIEWLIVANTDYDTNIIDYNTFENFPSTYEIGLYIKNKTTLLSEVVNLAATLGGFISFNNSSDKVEIYRLEEPGVSPINLYIIDDDILHKGISIARIEEPKKSITLGYRKNWTSQSNLATSLTDPSSPFYDIDSVDSYKNDYTERYLKTNVDEAEFPLLEDVDLVGTTIYNLSDAITELQRRIIIRSKRRRVIRLETVATSFTYRIGSIVNITHPRFGLSSGESGMLISIEEDPSSKQVILEVWF